MIYLDTSVALAQLFAEDREPPAALWETVLVSSRLMQYELWNRVHARRLGPSHGDAVRALVDRVAFLDLLPGVLSRALEPFPVPVRTLDALHLASMEYLRSRDIAFELASYDEQLNAAARRLKIPLADLA